ncbi:MAG: 50S ribosomal protein L3 [Deltaproteobacteria bacterium]|nr:50S ribosomal protein L3 [Deltaproteobacteria bacterium]
MALGLIGKKLGMTQIYSPQGEAIPVTVIELGPCTVVQKKVDESDGYNALQLGFGDKKIEKCSKPALGHFKKHGDKAYTVLKEFRAKDAEYQVGDAITTTIFEKGEFVRITGVSKGKGFAGNIKRHGFACGPMTHGSKFHRAVGSSGMSAWPSKVLKGKKMPGHLGTDKVTVKNLEIIETREAENIILLKGAVPGVKNGIVTVCKL